MELFNRLEDCKDQLTPLVLTIGIFDGVHLGHEAVFRQVKSTAAGKLKTLALTFSNHPADVLRPSQLTKLICTLDHRIKLIEKAGIDQLLLLPFTNNLAQHSAASFVERLRQFIPFTHLILGFDATLGRDRQGNRLVMEELGHDWGFKVVYLDEFRYEGHPVSSSRIRQLITEGELEKVSTLLGRPYSIYTTDLDVKGLCLPPKGEYTVDISVEGENIRCQALIDPLESHIKLIPHRSLPGPVEIVF